MQKIFKRHTVQLVSLIVLTASLAACGGGGSGSAPSANATDTQVSAPATPVSTTPPATSTPEDPAPVTSASNHAPTISGAPVTSVTSGQAYSFVPTAADADHDTLQFSISSKPSWATFDAATGKLFGTPTSASAGSYEEIEISVSDGKLVTKLPQFAIVVNAGAATRSVHVTWQPPSINTDGSALTDLKGYRIVYGTQPGVYTNSVPVNGTGLVDYTVENLQTGQKYYFSMVAVNAAGAESDYSQEVVVNLT
jgi:Putative Ig domain